MCTMWSYEIYPYIPDRVTVGVFLQRRSPITSHPEHDLAPGHVPGLARRRSVLVAARV